MKYQQNANVDIGEVFDYVEHLFYSCRCKITYIIHCWICIRRVVQNVLKENANASDMYELGLKFFVPGIFNDFILVYQCNIGLSGILLSYKMTFCLRSIFVPLIGK